MKKISYLIAFMLLFALIIYPYPQTTKADDDPTTYIMWTCSDMHIRPDGGSYTCAPGTWSNVIGDAITLGANISICVGDCVEDIGSEAAWDYFWENDGYTYGWEETIDYMDFTQVTIGNHCGGWGLGMPSPYGDRFTHTFGNVLLIGINDSYAEKYAYEAIDGSSWAGRYQVWNLDWVNETIQNNQDKNIILFVHHPIYNTTYESGGDQGGAHTMYVYESSDGCSPGYGCGWAAREENTNFTNMLEWLEANDYHLDAWVCGHTHADEDQTNFVEKHGTTFINDLKISVSGGSETRSSLFWYFTDGSSKSGSV